MTTSHQGNILVYTGTFTAERPAARPTRDTYEALQLAYEHFNRALFGGRLPECLITMQRKGGCYGYFCGDRFATLDGTERTDEIALNPRHIRQRTTRSTLSTLVHEMAHLWQHRFGKASPWRYHNREWADMMESVGLHPSSTGEPGGKRTGQRVSHYIVDGGPFDRACAELLESGFTLTWGDAHGGEPSGGRAGRRARYTCHACGLNAWAKPDASLVCGECGVAMEPTAGGWGEP